MLIRYNLEVESDFQHPLLGLADRLGIDVFSNSIIIDPDKGEADFILSETIIVSFVASTIEQDTDFIYQELLSWLADFQINSSALSITKYSENEDWMLNFKQFFKPIYFGSKIVVTPPWEKIEKSSDDTITILIDPGMAFGTGTHETTRLCLELLKDIDVSGKTFIDAGAGSGILSFYMMKAMAKSGIAIEIDSRAIHNLQKNLKLNEITNKLEVFCSPLNEFKLTSPVDCLLANITSPVIIENLSIISNWVKQGGIGIFAGINSTNVDEVKKHFNINQWTIVKEITEGSWHGLYSVKN